MTIKNKKNFSLLEKNNPVKEIKSRVIFVQGKPNYDEIEKMYKDRKKQDRQSVKKQKNIPGESRKDIDDKISVVRFIETPYPMTVLRNVVEQSNIIPQCIEAYEINIDGIGHKFPLIVNDVEKKKIDKNILDKELLILNNFFETSTPDSSFTKLRRETRRDLETYGNAYWEVIRDGNNKVAELNKLDPEKMRLMKLSDAIKITQKIRIKTNYEEVTRFKKFRRYVQLNSFNTVSNYFKEFGDVRPINKDTGEVDENIIGNVKYEATEVIHFKIGNSIYGMPRWLGSLLCSVGSRYAEEINYKYFKQGMHVPLAILVSGGMLNEESIKKVEDYIEEAKGIDSAHKILIIEAESSNQPFDTKSGSVKIELKPLKEILQSDALFQEYDKNNRMKIKSAFRLPGIIIGEDQNYDRATAEASILTVHSQVFDPEKDEFDDKINRTIVTDLGIRYYTYRTKRYIITDPKTLMEVVKKFDDIGVITPRMVQGIAEMIMDIDIDYPDDANWLDIPMKITFANAQQGRVSMPGEQISKDQIQKNKEEDIVDFIQVLKKIRKGLIDNND